MSTVNMVMEMDLDSENEAMLEDGLLFYEKTQKELDDEIKKKKEKQVNGKIDFYVFQFSWWFCFLEIFWWCWSFGCNGVHNSDSNRCGYLQSYTGAQRRGEIDKLF